MVSVLAIENQVIGFTHLLGRRIFFDLIAGVLWSLNLRANNAGSGFFECNVKGEVLLGLGSVLFQLRQA